VATAWNTILHFQLPDLFTFRTASDGRERVYFLGAPSGKKENTLMYADVTRDGQVLPWKQLVSICDPVDTAASALSKVAVPLVYSFLQSNKVVLTI